MSRNDFQIRAARRLNVCFDLFDLGVEMMEQRLRRDDPGATEEELHARLVTWLHERPGAEYGDSVGRPVRWADVTT